MPVSRYFEFLGTSLGPVYGLYSGSQTQPPCARLNWMVATQLYDIRSSQVNRIDVNFS